MGKTTNRLIELANSVSAKPDKRELDMLMATGEQVSVSILSMVLKEKGYESISLTGFQAGIKTEGTHTKNMIKDRSRIPGNIRGRRYNYFRPGRFRHNGNSAGSET